MYRLIPVLLITVLLLKSLFADAQIADNQRRFLNNIVQVSAQQFGLIVGSKGTGRIYFITASPTRDDVPATLTARFYGSGQKAASTLVKKFSFGSADVYLFSAEIGIPVNWQRYSYTTMSSMNAPFYSYLDNNRFDSTWFINTTPMRFNDRISEHVSQLIIASDDNFYQGMPVIDQQGRITGIISNAQENQPAAFVVNLQSIAAAIQSFGACDYFSLVAFGQSATPCETARRLQEQQQKSNQKFREDNQVYGLVVGPAFSANYNFRSAGGGFGFAAGMNFYFNPDRGRIGVTVKPRYTYLPARVDTDDAFTGIGFKRVSYRTRLLEAPVVLEWRTKRYNYAARSYIALGYGPGYQLPLVYRYTTTNQTKTARGIMKETAGYTHKVLAETGINGADQKFSFTVAYQFPTWVNRDATAIVEGETVYPAWAETGGIFMVSIDVAFRLKGRWGMKLQ